MEITEKQPLESSHRRIAWLLFALVFLSTGYFFQSGGDNENSRLAQVRMLSERGQLEIDEWAYRSADVVVFESHIYPNKAPGLTFLSLPAWKVSWGIASRIFDSNELREHVACFLTTWLVDGIALGLLTVMFFYALLFSGYQPYQAVIGCIALSGGTILFAFSTLFFSHVVAAAVLFGAYFLLEYVIPNSHLRARKILTLAAGMLAGYSIAIEYPCALGAALLGLAVLLRRGWRDAVLFGLGGVVGIVPLLLYNVRLFHNPLFVAYSVYAQSGQSMFPEHQTGFLGVKLPSLNNLYEVTFGPQRGLFRMSPWLLCFLPGMMLGLRDEKRKAETILCAAIFIAFMLFNAAYGDSIVFWGGGASFGPRHMIPGIPFAALVACHVLRSTGWLVTAIPLATLSVCISLLGAAVEPRVPYEYNYPVTDLLWRSYKSGLLSENWIGIFNSALTTKDSIAWNLGKLLTLPGALQLLPLMILWGIFANLLTRECRVRIPRIERSAMTLAALGFLCFGLVPVQAYCASTFLRSSGGLIGRTYAGNVFNNPEPTLSQESGTPPASDSSVIVERFDPMILFPNGVVSPLGTGISVEWRGVVLIESDGFYNFATDSDDGSAVYIDKQLVVNNWGTHGFQRKVSGLPLSAGAHDIAVRYFNEGNRGVLSLFWAAPGTHLRPIPSRNLQPGDAKNYASTLSALK